MLYFLSPRLLEKEITPPSTNSISMSTKPSDLHKGHRNRLKQRFVRDGLVGFEDHQALELLLFYALPRRDTNELAHRLIDSFGSLRNLFEADVADITKVSGAGESVAVLIKLLPEIAAKYWFTEGQETTKISSIESAAAYFKSLLYGKPLEHFYIACLDASFRVKSSTLLSKGTPTQTPVFIRHIAEASFRSGTEMLMLAHNHPGGSVSPSRQDIELTMEISTAMETLQIRLLDHIIISDDLYYSFAAQKLLRNNYSPEQAHAARYSTGLMNDVSRPD